MRIHGRPKPVAVFCVLRPLRAMSQLIISNRANDIDLEMLIKTDPHVTYMTICKAGYLRSTAIPVQD